jgi:spore coat polysaccharide biosynthesis predicted glycosyltransferase SpsG
VLNYPHDGQLYLLGPEYLLVRRPLRIQRQRLVRRIDEEVHRVLITMGGVDRLGLTRRILGLLGTMMPDISGEGGVGRE